MTGARFTESDYRILRREFDRLSAVQKRVLILMFWNDYMAHELSAVLRLPVERVEAEARIACAILKHQCVVDPEFSRGPQLYSQAA